MAINFERLRDRKISVEDLYQQKLWRESEPEALDEPWVKEFGAFKIFGDGSTRGPRFARLIRWGFLRDGLRGCLDQQP